MDGILYILFVVIGLAALRFTIEITLYLLEKVIDSYILIAVVFGVCIALLNLETRLLVHNFELAVKFFI